MSKATEYVFTASIGRLEEFNVSEDNWSLYIERLEQYFLVNNVSEKFKVATLITVMGRGSYELLVTLCDPDKPSTKSFGQVVKIMQDHLQPQPFFMAERYTFRRRLQAADETIAEFATALKRLARDCKFGSELDNNLRDQFCCGVYKEHIRQRLFTSEDITFAKAYQMAVSREAAEANAAAVTEPSQQSRASGQPGPSGAAAAVQRVAAAERGRTGRGSGRLGTRRGGRIGGDNARTSYNNFRNNNNGSLRQLYCDVCGGKHDSTTCKFKFYTCRVCNREGHLKKVCPRLSKVTTGIQNLEVNEQDVSGVENDIMEVNMDTIQIYNIKNFKSFKPFLFTLNVNNKDITMEVDTGSAISCISKDCYANVFCNLPLHKTNLVINYYSGEQKYPVGKITPRVKYKNITKNIDLYVIDNGSSPLLGRQWLSELGISLSQVHCNQIVNNNSKSETDNIEMLIARYSNVFAEGLGRFTGGAVSLRVRADARPVFLRARPLAYALREPVERALEQLEREGVISPVESSDWATPIVPVIKKEGSLRICGDYKQTLNKYLEIDRFPLPRVEDLLTKLHGGQKFSKIDLSQAYAQLELDEASKMYTVINTHKGLYKYNRLVYGISSSPGIFQRKLEQMFADMPTVGVFLDDVIITGQNDKIHMQNLSKVLERLHTYGLRVKKQKCTFFADSVTYLGYIISKDGIHTCPDKIDAINKVGVPRNVSELRSFLGMVMYYAKFVRNISMILVPLYNLLKKENRFEWSKECSNAFSRVKKLLVSSQVLIHYDPDLPLTLTTDASSTGVGAVIAHKLPDGRERPIAYASRVLNSAEKNYSPIQKEALAIIFGVKKYHQYLYGRKFLLKTDHKPLVSIFGDKGGIPTMAASRLQRWAVILSGYQYDIQYVPSEKNSADALSRLPVGEKNKEKEEVTYVNFVQNFLPITNTQVQSRYKDDPLLRRIVMFLESGWPTSLSELDMQPYFIRKNELYLEAGCIMWGYRMVIPPALRENILKELHVGHVGMVKMKANARSYVWWPGIDKDIERTCRECSTCTAEAAAPPRAPPQPWPYPTEPWSRIHIDFLGPFQGHTFFIIIDASTKWIEAFEMKRTTASEVTKTLREVFARFGIPKQIISDNGPPFSSIEFSNFMESNGIEHKLTPIYHPASNGAAENAVKLCKKAIKKAVREKCELSTALQAYLLTYRNSIHSTTGQSPAMLLLKRRLRSRLDLLREGGQSILEKVEIEQGKQVERAGGILRALRVGDKVWVRVYSGGEKWINGTIREVLGSRCYMIETESGLAIKRHIDQIRAKAPQTKSDDSAGKVLAWDSDEEETDSVPPVISEQSAPKRIRKPVKRYGDPVYY